MIKHKFIVNRRYWKVYVYYNVSKRNINEILDKLENLNFPDSYVTSAYTMLNNNKLNSGRTFSNIRNKVSVVIIGKTSNATEFVNSFVHEIAHLSNHIARAYNLNLDNEEVCYLSGDIAQEMFKYCHRLMCDCCRDT